MNLRLPVLLPAVGLAAGCAAAVPATGPIPLAGDAPDRGCAAELIVRFSPSVRTPGNQGFLSGLMQGTGFNLVYRRNLGPEQFVLALESATQPCEDGLRHLAADTRIRSVEVSERKFRHAPPGDAR